MSGRCEDTISKRKAIDTIDAVFTVDAVPAVQPEKQYGRIFQEIVVEYPSICIHPEYKGKPYFLIKYTENEQEFIGYGTYKPEVLSEFLKEYFLPSAQPTLNGYNIEHLKLIATVLQKENIPPERIAEIITNIGRIVAIVKDEYDEALRKAVEQCTI